MHQVRLGLSWAGVAGHVRQLRSLIKLTCPWLQRSEELRTALFSWWHRAVLSWNREAMACGGKLHPPAGKGSRLWGADRACHPPSAS